MSLSLNQSRKIGVFYQIKHSFKRSQSDQILISVSVFTYNCCDRNSGLLSSGKPYQRHFSLTLNFFCDNLQNFNDQSEYSFLGG